MLDAILSAVLSLDAIFVLSGLLLAAIGLRALTDRAHPSRIGSGLFWLLLGVTFAAGSFIPAWLTGALVVVIVLLDAFGLVRPGGVHDGDTVKSRPPSIGPRIFIPVLLIPLLTYLSILAFSRLSPDINRVVYVSLGYASIIAVIAAMAITRARPREAVTEGQRIAEAIGAVVILPQLLAALGSLFRTAGVSDVIAHIVTAVTPSGSIFGIVAISCIAIAVLAFFLGNSFAAFPVVMTGIGIPLLVVPLGADGAAVGLLLLTGASCGTLCTPMAANFNIVPPLLLEMKDEWGVMKFQAPFAVAMLGAHILLLWLAVTWFVR